ncbi:MAG: hypothetical protein Hyperionvirus23_19 [Hyperionvirus sp.]|uniref:Ankyrin repeat protein n=1 Tax=Hyperionvirus sp. TaxID=2487770 RepID=A0A3G5AB45_9VIRU|nr:MAG: hypothetical protein Hyperionvirus23_19 [Hyperionvirus sp.]
MEKWPVLYHLITNMYDIELLKTMHTDDKQTSLLLHLLFSPIFDERWFKVILHFMDQNKFDLKYKGTNGLTLLDGAIHQNNIFLIQYFICKGLKFTDSTGATGRDFVQSCIYLSKDSLLKRYQTIEACIKYGYDITTKDKNGLTLRDYIEKYIPKKHNGKYIELLR